MYVDSKLLQKSWVKHIYWASTANEAFSEIDNRYGKMEEILQDKHVFSGNLGDLVGKEV